MLDEQSQQTKDNSNEREKYKQWLAHDPPTSTLRLEGYKRKKMSQEKRKRLADKRLLYLGKLNSTHPSKTSAAGGICNVWDSTHLESVT